MTRPKIVLSVALIVGALLAGMGGPSWASTIMPVLKANPGLTRSEALQLPLVVQRSSVVIDPSIRIGMPLVYPDGSVVPGQSAEATRQAVACGGTAFGTGVGTWGPVSSSTCGYIGHPGATITYTWNVPAELHTQACAIGSHWVMVPPRTYYIERFEQVGLCGTGSYRTMTWGNIAAVPHFQVRSISMPAGVTVRWSH